MLHELYHWLAWTWGGDGQGGGNGPGYLIFSGPLADVSILTAAVAFYWKHACHVHWCFRIGRHRVEGTPHLVVCRHHHPDPAPTAADLQARRHPCS